MPNNQISLLNEQQGIDKTMETLLDGLPLPVYLINIDGGIRYTNPAFNQMTGFSDGELAGDRPPCQFWPEQSRENLTLLLKESKPSKQKLRHKTGASIWVEISVTEVIKDKQTQYYIVSCIDITRQVQQAQALKDSENKFNTIFNSVPLALSICTLPDLRFVSVNEAFLKNSGYQRDEIIGCKNDDLNWTDLKERDAILAAMKTNASNQEIEINLKSKSGEKSTSLLSTCRIQLGDKTYLLSASSDITERKKTEQLLKESDAFSAGLLQHSANPILVRDESGKIEYVNPALESLTGYNAAEIIGSGMPYKWWPPEVVAAYTHQRPETYLRAIDNLETKFINKSGQPFWVKITRRQVSQKGKATFYFSNWVDVTASKLAQEALQKSEEQFRKVFENSPVGMIIADGNLRFTRVNQALCQMTGYTQDELLNMRSSDITLGVDSPEDLAHYQNIYRDLIPFYHTQKRFIRKDQAVIWVDFNLSAMRQSNQFLNYLIFVKDITERMTAQERLLNSEKNFRDSLENSPLAIRIVNSQEETIFANQTFLRFAGFLTLDEYLAAPPKAIYSAASYKKHLDIKRRRQAGLPIPAEYELEIKRNNGDLRRLLVSRGEVIWNNQKQDQVIYQDITEKAQFERALKESEKKYRTLFETMAQGVIYLDERGDVASANPAAHTIMGLTTDEMRKNILGSLKKAFIREDGSEFPESEKPGITALKSGQKVKDVVMGVFNPVDNKYHWINFCAVPQFHQGQKKPYQVYLTLSDITVLKEAQALSFETEALKRVNQTKTDLLANVSHELRTPLASIKGFIETLLETDVEWDRSQQLEFLRSANQEADHLTFLIRDLLDMSRMDAGRMVLDKQKVEISEILEAAKNVLTVVADKHQLKINVEPDLPMIKADKNRIAQVITNLVENGCKFSAAGSKIELKIKKAGNDVVFSVRDHGIGMSNETLSQLFNRFYQAQMVVTGKTRGTGLGLAISKGIVESHGGLIKVKSKLGHGSLIAFSIPVDAG